MRRSLFLLLATATATVALAGPVSAKGGSGGGGGGGGGGTTTSAGAIRDASGTAFCDAGTIISVSLRKGFDKRVEAQVAPLAEGTNPDGTPAGMSWWSHRLVNTTTNTQVGAWANNSTMAPGLVQTILLGTVPVGTHTLTYTATRKQLTAPNVIDLAALATQPVVENCTVNITVTAR